MTQQMAKTQPVPPVKTLRVQEYHQQQFTHMNKPQAVRQVPQEATVQEPMQAQVQQQVRHKMLKA